MAKPLPTNVSTSFGNFLKQFFEKTPVPGQTFEQNQLISFGNTNHIIATYLGSNGHTARMVTKPAEDSDNRHYLMLVEQAGHFSATEEIEASLQAPHTPTRSLVVSDATLMVTKSFLPPVPWPSIEWEKAIVETAGKELCLPIHQHHTSPHAQYLLQQIPEGTPLDRAWAAPITPWSTKFRWLMAIVRTLQQFAGVGVLCPLLRPEMFLVDQAGRLIWWDLSSLVPLPIPEGYQPPKVIELAPELLESPQLADFRAGIYAFGMLFARLSCGLDAIHEMIQEDSFVPLLNATAMTMPEWMRIMTKCLFPTIPRRFPTPAQKSIDPTGFSELLEALQTCELEVCRHHFAIATATNIGTVRSGNEDAVGVMIEQVHRHATQRERAIVVLADGMGGMASGEVAARITVDKIRTELARDLGITSRAAEQQTNPEDILAASVASENNTAKLVAPDSKIPTGKHVQEQYATKLYSLIEATNMEVLATGNSTGSAGMGCTLEALILDNEIAVVGHVGDSRVYHYRNGKLTLITTDQTRVNRMLINGQLTVEEALNHPRRSELEQAIGGRPAIFPDIHQFTTQPGDRLLICSDGLTGVVNDSVLEAILSEAWTVEKMANYMLSVAMAAGADDNVTVAVIEVIGAS
ncbi:MAG: protein phosphatase 2C domain-containing protein [Zavarzinella sp.]